jgi:hypothetical protein
MLKRRDDLKIGRKGSVFLTMVLEYLSAELLDMAGTFAK